MRKYVCEYCGNIYDAEKNGRCPSCGGPISKQAKDQIAKEQKEQRARNARLAEDVIRRHEIETQNRKKLKHTENRTVYIHNSYNYTRNSSRSRRRVC